MLCCFTSKQTLLSLPQVHSEGLVVEEDGAAPTHRVLLSDVSAEAVAAFLRYLYAADTKFPAGLRPQLQALAARCVPWACFGSPQAFSHTDPSLRSSVAVLAAYKFHGALLHLK